MRGNARREWREWREWSTWVPEKEMELMGVRTITGSSWLRYSSWWIVVTEVTGVTVVAVVTVAT